MHLRPTAAAAGLALALASPAWAQRDDATRPSATQDTSFSVGDIVVTAGEMMRAPSNVVTSIDRLGGDVAQRQNVDNSWELFARLPGVSLTDFNQGTTSGRFSIRGFNGEGERDARRRGGS